MSKVTKNQRITELEKQVAIISRVLCTPYDYEPQLKQLDQSVFDGLDDDITYAVVKSNGEGVASNKRLNARSGCEFWAVDLNAKIINLGQGFDPTNWQNSLIERKQSELTGSDLTRAMLERGDKFVMCFVSGMSDAKADSIPKAITSFNSLTQQFRANHDIWRYAVPINNQGEPLTAQEVEL